MRASESLYRQNQVARKFDEARERFREVRRGLYKPFRKTQKFTIEIIPSPFSDLLHQPIIHRKAPEESIPSSSSSSSIRSIGQAMDGTGEKRFGRSRTPAPVSAIFVHAGAGYHSTTNEHIHLGACNDAARLAMKVLKSGGTAVDAVEAAIKVLEDKEITNAGYGSNLTIEGVVECDATVVDHLGRSGACGATAKIKNPINLARLILDRSSRPLSLRRVPPNLLVGEGATDFAWENNMAVVPHDAIVSKAARERFVRWREDLKRAAGARMTPGSSDNSTCGDETLDLEYEERVRNKQRRDHTNALLNGTWNEGQPDSPQPRSPAAPSSPSQEPTHFLPNQTTHSPDSSPSTDKVFLNPLSPAQAGSKSSSSPPSRYGGSPSKRPRFGASGSSDGQARTHSLLGPNASNPETTKSSSHVLMSLGELSDYPKGPVESHDGSSSPADPGVQPDEFLTCLDAALALESGETTPRAQALALDEDLITDTVGAIAIDMFGNIAAGSSSGGIGMKHQGRVGPAALVGVGTAVIPADPQDPENITVAAVTSGTGEHMATTMASQKCAERLYYCTRRGRAGANVDATEPEAIESFVQYDFMDHPGVRNSHSVGAIGVMAVKKMSTGYFLYFAHNTDSFALASMHSNEKDAKCVMSRIGDHGSVIQGGRKIRVD